jgi:hypothetical protein
LRLLLIPLWLLRLLELASEVLLPPLLRLRLIPLRLLRLLELASRLLLPRLRKLALGMWPHLGWGLIRLWLRHRRSRLGSIVVR